MNEKQREIECSQAHANIESANEIKLIDKLKDSKWKAIIRTRWTKKEKNWEGKKKIRFVTQGCWLLNFNYVLNSIFLEIPPREISENLRFSLDGRLCIAKNQTRL